MNYRTLGRTNFSVSDVGHGLWGMSNWSGGDDDASRAALRLSASLGCNFYDTAWAYGDGKSDALLGELLRTCGTTPGSPTSPPLAWRGAGASAVQLPNRQLIAASKIPPKNRKWPATSDYKYRDVFPADYCFDFAERIRAELGVETIDLLQFHVWDDSWAAEKEFRYTVEILKQRGLVRAFGLSLNRWEPSNGLRALRTGLIDAVQVIYNIFDQAPEDELFPACRELRIGIIARVPLDEGSLGGKLTRETHFPSSDWRAGYFNKENLAATMDRVEALQRILPGGMSLPELAIRFILSNPDVSTTIIGMRREEHVRQNLSFSDRGPLPPELLRELKQHRWDRKPKRWSA
jgi:aryl-alcohol dehydrogenase-like predicted oxidoreductase